jgi:DNA polymerase-3 subunit gamma/tau
MDRGREPLIVLQNLASFYRDLLIAKTAPNRSDLVAVTPPTWNELREFVKQLDVPSILLSSQHLKNSEAQIKNTTQPRLWLEVTLLGLLPSANLPQLREQENPTTKIQGASYSGATPRNPAPQNSKFTQPPASANTSTPAVSQSPSQVEPAQASQASPPAPAHRNNTQPLPRSPSRLRAFRQKVQLMPNQLVWRKCARCAGSCPTLYARPVADKRLLTRF